MGVEIERGGKPLLATEVQDDIAVAGILNLISPLQNIKILAANDDMLIECFLVGCSSCRRE